MNFTPTACFLFYFHLNLKYASVKNKQQNSETDKTERKRLGNEIFISIFM